MFVLFTFTHTYPEDPSNICGSHEPEYRTLCRFRGVSPANVSDKTSSAPRLPTRTGGCPHCSPGGLQRPLCRPPEQLPSLLGRHGIAALQQICDDERLLNAGGLHPQTSIHPHHQLTGEQLLQVGQDLTVRGQQSGGAGQDTQSEDTNTDFI